MHVSKIKKISVRIRALATFDGTIIILGDIPYYHEDEDADVNLSRWIPREDEIIEEGIENVLFLEDFDDVLVSDYIFERDLDTEIADAIFFGVIVTAGEMEMTVTVEYECVKKRNDRLILNFVATHIDDLVNRPSMKYDDAPGESQRT